jgi:hypothetical protein
MYILDPSDSIIVAIYKEEMLTVINALKHYINRLESQLVGDQYIYLPDSTKVDKNQIQISRYIMRSFYTNVIKLK